MPREVILANYKVACPEIPVLTPQHLSPCSLLLTPGSRFRKGGPRGLQASLPCTFWVVTAIKKHWQEIIWQEVREGSTSSFLTLSVPLPPAPSLDTVAFLCTQPLLPRGSRVRPVLQSHRPCPLLPPSVNAFLPVRPRCGTLRALLLSSVHFTLRSAQLFPLKPALVQPTL